MFARPSLTKLGNASARDLAMWPSVLRPVSSYSAASGNAPIPTLSSTIQIMRSNAPMVCLGKSIQLGFFETNGGPLQMQNLRLDCLRDIDLQSWVAENPAAVRFPREAGGPARFPFGCWRTPARWCLARRPACLLRKG